MDDMFDLPTLDDVIIFVVMCIFYIFAFCIVVGCLLGFIYFVFGDLIERQLEIRKNKSKWKK